MKNENENEIDTDAAADGAAASAAASRETAVKIVVKPGLLSAFRAHSIGRTRELSFGDRRSHRDQLSCPVGEMIPYCNRFCLWREAWQIN